MKEREAARGGQFALIPAAVLYDGQIPATAKLLYGEIYRLSRAGGYCYASNRNFMDLLRCSEATVSRLISALARRGHIRVQMVRRYGTRGDIVQRRIFCAGENPPEGVRGGEETSPRKGGDGPRRDEDHTPKKTIHKNPPPSPEGEGADWFDGFWRAYPKKKGREAARRAWKKLSPDRALCRAMGEALARQKRSEDWAREDGRFIPYPASWLSGRRWEDETPPEPPEQEAGVTYL